MNSDKEKLNSVLRQVRDLDYNFEISDEHNIYDDLGADSLGSVELIMGLESEYDIEISDDEIDDIVTVGQIAQLIKNLS